MSYHRHQSLIYSITHELWIWTFFAMLIATFIIAALLYRWSDYLLEKHISVKKESHRYAILKAISLPVVLAEVAFGVAECIHFFNYHYLHVIRQPWLETIVYLVYLGLGWLASHRFISSYESRMMTMVENQIAKVDQTTLQALLHLLRIALFVLVVLLGMQLLGMPMSAILAFGGIGGVGFAFAAKDLLANFFGGVIIFFDRPFEVGDWIRSPDRNIEGTVVKIGWRVTQIITFDKRPMYIPNSIFLTIVLENASRMTNRRIKTTIGLRYADAKVIEKLVDAMEEMLRHHPGIDTNMTLFVKMAGFGESSLDILVYAFTKTTEKIEFHSVQQDIFLKLLELIEAHGAECAFPSRTVYHYSDVPRDLAGEDD